MKQSYFLGLIVCAVMVLTGCNEVFDRKPKTVTVTESSLVFTYNLETSDGTVATAFKEGETVVNRFTVKNNSADTLYMAYVYSHPIVTWRFGLIYRASDGASYGPGVTQQPFEPCRHIVPSGEQTWTVECVMKDGVFLPEDDYYCCFTPKFGYFPVCNHTYQDSIKMRTVDLPEMRIDFEVTKVK